ncbi:MAG: hypothetical protein Q8K99_14920 [Actinomycetota bacterium]|nr:hypothetical protein [Actinomycetota bacterium]
MSEERVGYGTKPAQFRLPIEMHEFLARESTARGVTKTEIVLEAIADLERKRFEENLAEGYVDMQAHDAAEAVAWDGTRADGLEPDGW